MIIVLLRILFFSKKNKIQIYFLLEKEAVIPVNYLKTCPMQSESKICIDKFV